MSIEAAKKIRNELCLDSECTFDKGCGCLEVIGAALAAKESENKALRTERDELYGYVNGLLELLQLVRGRNDMPPEIGEALNTNHRAVDAAAYLTQIVPPSPLAAGQGEKP